MDNTSLDYHIRVHKDEGCKYWKGKCIECPYPLISDECFGEQPLKMKLRMAEGFMDKIEGLISFYQENMEG